MVADACFHMPAHVRNNRDTLRQDFARRLAEVDSHNDLPDDEARQSQAVATATFAAGLFALGDVRMAPRVLEMPDVQERIVILKSVLDAMLPDEFEDRSPEALATAALSHADRLEFDEVSGVYRLTGFV
jgi:hypothetical protein